MNAFLLILFISLLAVFFLILFAFFPIKISWFYYQGKPDKATGSVKTAAKNKSAISYDFSREYKNYSRKDEDVFDDPEL